MATGQTLGKVDRMKTVKKKDPKIVANTKMGILGRMTNNFGKKQKLHFPIFVEINANRGSAKTG